MTLAQIAVAVVGMGVVDPTFELPAIGRMRSHFFRVSRKCGELRCKFLQRFRRGYFTRFRSACARSERTERSERVQLLRVD